MLIRILGPVELEDGDGRAVTIGGTKERAVLAALALHANQVVSVDHLVDALWGESPPRTAERTLQGYVSRIRKALSEAGVDGRTVLDSTSAGWCLRLGHGSLDLADAEHHAAAGQAAVAAGDHVGAALAFGDALRGWRGRPLGDLADQPWAVGERTRLDELRLHIVEERLEAELACGRHARVIGELAELCRQQPLRERPWRLRMLALYRSGRQAEALRAYQEVRGHLADELGIAPGEQLRALERAVLDQAAWLEWRPADDSPGERHAGVEAPAVGLPPSGVVTLLFTDVVGSTAALGRLGEDAWGRVRSAHFRMLRERVAWAGGVEVKTLGDGLFAVFSEPDGAIAAAVAIQQAVARQRRRSTEERIEVRIGVQSGTVRLEDGDYFGSAVVVASRLCAAAGGSEILTSALVAELLSDPGAVDLGEVRHLHLKGIEEPLAVRSVRWTEHGPRPLPAELVAQRAPAFVGRLEELTGVEAAWERAQQGRGQVLLLAGEPGIGKTALCIRAAERAWAQGAVVLFGRCDESGVIAFQPWVEALAGYVATTRPATLRSQLGAQAADLALLVPEVARALPELGSVAGTGAETERYRVVAAVTSLISAITEEAPVLLVLDDLHWADQPTLHLLRQVMRGTSDTAVLVLGAYRDTDLVRTHPLAEMLVELRRAELVDRVPMRGLAEADVRDLVGGDGADDELVRALWEETEGSPLFLREILRHLDETGAVTRDSAGALRPVRRIAQLGIPEGVREVIGRRLTRLSEPANTALRAGSVLGRELRLDVLERVTGVGSDALLDAMEEATAAGILGEVAGVTGRWSFTHAIVRQSLYDELSLTRRVRIHQQVAEALEAIEGGGHGPHLAQLAYHFAQAAVAGAADKAIDYSCRAGEYASTLGAHEEAARHYGVAVEVAEDAGTSGAEQVELLLAKAASEWKASADPTLPRATLARALPLLAPDDGVGLGRVAALHVEQSHRWLDLDVDAVSTELLERALATLPQEDSPLRAQLLASLAQSYYFDEAERVRSEGLAREAMSMARRLGDPAAIATVAVVRGTGIYDPAEFRSLVTDYEDVVAWARATGNRAYELDALGLLCLFRGAVNDSEGSAAAYADWRRLAVEEHDPRALLMTCLWEAGIASIEGRLADAEQGFLRAFAQGQETGNPVAFTYLGPGVGGIRLLQGRIIEVIGSTSEYIDFYPAVRPVLLGILAMSYAEAGMPDEARTFLRELDLSDPLGFSAGVLRLYALHHPSRAAFLLDDAEAGAAAHALQEPYAGMAAGFGPAMMGSVDYGLALSSAAMRRWDLADRHFHDAHAIHDRIGARAIAAECRFFHAAALERAGRPGDVDRALALADLVVVAAGELGMDGRMRDAQRLQARLRGDRRAEDALVRPRTNVRLRDRAKAKLAIRGRAAAASWSAGRTDEHLARRFESPRAQRGLFTGMARAFQPAMAFGFEGELVFELRPLDDDGDPRRSDWWTLAVRDGKATARPGRSQAPRAVIHARLPDFIRVSTGEVPATQALLGGTITVDGDVMAISRLPDLFGMVAPIDGLELPVD